MSSHFRITLLLLFAGMNFCYAQLDLRFEIEKNKKGLYDLKNLPRNEYALTDCISIDTLAFTDEVYAVKDTRYLFFKQKNKFGLFHLKLGRIVFLQKEETYELNLVTVQNGERYQKKTISVSNPSFIEIETTYNDYIFNLNTATTIYSYDWAGIRAWESKVNHHICISSRNVYVSSVIDQQGNIIADSAEDITELENGNYLVCKISGYSVVSATGQNMFPNTYRYMRSFTGCGDLLLARDREGKTGVISTRGEIKIPFEYEDRYYCGFYSGSDKSSFGLNGVFFLYKKNYVTVLDSNNRVLADSLTAADDFCIIADRFVFCLKNKLEGVFDTQQKKMSVPCLYHLDSVYDNTKLPNEKHLIGVSAAGKWGLINMETGQAIIPLIYQTDIRGANPEGRSGRESITLTLINDSLFAVKKNGLWGIVNLQGKEIIAFEYSEMGFIKSSGNNYLVRVNKNGLYGLIELNTGKTILSCEYTKITDRLYLEKEENGTVRTGYLVNKNNTYEISWDNK